MNTRRSTLQLVATTVLATLVASSILGQPAAPPAQPGPGGSPGGGRGGRGGAATFAPQTPIEALATLPPVTATNAADALKDIKVPEEFDVTIFATPPAVNYPTYVAAAPNGTLYVAIDGNGAQGRAPHLGRILRLRDTNGDGQADEVKPFVPDVDSPRGLIWDHDRLYSLHPPTISAYIDRDGDGVPEEEQVLIKGMGWTLADRSVDHGEEGLVLGIDGWIYAAIGDYGFLKAEGTDGRKVQLRGGGVIRFRPDGTGLEIWATGTRNIYDLALSPLLDGFARDNTNDGGGWDVRFHHFTGLTEHGYPSLFKNFPDEIVQPIADYGGGGPTGALWLDEPGMPERWNHAPLTADWGRNQIYHHTLTPHGATFKVTQEPFIGMTRVTDLDVDANSTLYISSWKGAVFNWAGPNAGYIIRATPKGYRAEPLPDFDKLSNAGLVGLLESPSQRRRIEAQRALLRRSGMAREVASRLEKLAADPTKLLSYRVAGLFTLKQIQGAASHSAMAKLAKDPSIAAWAIRAIGDRPEETKTMPVALVVTGLKSGDPRVRKESLITLSRAGALKEIPAMVPLMADADPIVAHTAVQVLKQLKAGDAAFAVLDSPTSTEPLRAGALRVLQSLHETKVVDGLISRLQREPGSRNRLGFIIALCRLANIQGEWSGAWWGTRPDTRGPYFQPEAWSETPKISAALDAALEKSDPKETVLIGHEFDRHRVPVGKAVTKLIAQADAEPSLVPLITAQLAESEEVPASAVPLLVKTALGAETAVDVRAQSVIALAKTDNPEAWKALLPAMQKLPVSTGRGGLGGFGGRGGGAGGRGGQGAPGGPGAAGSPGVAPGGAPGAGGPGAAAGPGGRGGGQGGGAGGRGGRGGGAADQARTAILNSPKLDKFYPVFVEQAAKLDGESSKLADSVLVSLAARKIGSVEARNAATKALEAGWTDPKRRAQIILASVTARDSSRAAQMVEAVYDPDKDVAQAAQTAIQQLGIDPEAIRAEALLPRIASLPVPEVLDAVVKTRGVVRRGQQLFTELGCVACHTTSATEPLKGPFLGNIANTYRRRELAEAILLPNKTIAQGFVANHFELKNGDELDGFVVREAADTITIRTVTAQEQKIPVAQIVKREKQEKSLMPEGLAAGLTVPDLASLLDYLEGLAKP